MLPLPPSLQERVAPIVKPAAVTVEVPSQLFAMVSVKAAGNGLIVMNGAGVKSLNINVPALCAVENENGSVISGAVTLVYVKSKPFPVPARQSKSIIIIDVPKGPGVIEAIFAFDDVPTAATLTKPFSELDRLGNVQLAGMVSLA